MNAPAGNPSPPQKSGGVLKWILLGCGGIILLIVAFFAISGYLLYRSMNTDPVKVEEASQEILKYEKPEGYKGVFSMSMMGVKMAMLSSGDPKSADAAMIVLATYQGGKMNQEQFQNQLKESLEKQGHSQQVSEQRPAETFKVKGKEVPAQVAVVQKQQTNAKAMQYTLALDGPSGATAMVMIVGPEKTVDHAFVQKFLDRVK
jgi:hypothetical protein